MRVLALLLLVPLAACGKGSAFDQGFRESYKTKFVQSCVTSANQAALSAGNAGAGGDFTRLCGCTADKLLAAHSATELMSGPPEAEQLAALQQCQREGGAPVPEASGRPGVKGLHDI